MALVYSAAIAVASACSDSTGPTAPASQVVLQADSAVYQLDTIGGASLHQVMFANNGAATVHVRFCSNDGFPAADIQIYRQSGANWTFVLGFTCINGAAGADSAIGPGREVVVANTYSPRATGVFRYAMVYARNDGVLETVTSAPFTVE